MAFDYDLFVIGAGSLLRKDGRTHFEHMAEKGIQPPTSKPAALAFEEMKKAGASVVMLGGNPINVAHGGVDLQEFQDKLSKLGMAVDFKPDTQFVSFLADETKRWRELIPAMGIQPVD